MNDKFKQLYSYLRDNNLTDLDENTFYSKYSDPNKSKEIYSYLKKNNMTDLDASSFHSSYFGTSKKKEQSVSPSKPKKEKSSLDIFDKMAEQPSASSVSKSDGDIYTLPQNPGVLYKKQGNDWYKKVGTKFLPLTQGNIQERYDVLNNNAKKVSQFELDRIEHTPVSIDPKTLYKEDPNDLKKQFENTYKNIKETEKADQLKRQEQIKKSFPKEEEKLNWRLGAGKIYDFDNEDEVEEYKNISPEYYMSYFDLDGKPLSVMDPEKTKVAQEKMKKDFGEREFKAYTSIAKMPSLNELKKIGVDNALNQKFYGTNLSFKQDGDELIVTSRIGDGINETILNQGKFNINDPNSDKRLRSFLASNIVKKSEREKFENAESIEDIVDLIGSKPYKFSAKLVEDMDVDGYFEKQKNIIDGELKSVNSESFENDLAQYDQSVKMFNEDVKKGRMSEEEFNKRSQQLQQVKKQLSERQDVIKRVFDRAEKLDKISQNFDKAGKIYDKKLENEGSFVGLVTRGFGKGLVNVSKANIDLFAAAAAPFVDAKSYADFIYGTGKYEQLKDMGLDDDEIKNQVQKDIKKTSNKFFSDVVDVYSFGTTEQYEKSSKRSEIDQAALAISESIGTAAGGLGASPSSAGVKAAFFAMSYNAMEDQMRGDHFDGLSENEKKLISVPYGIVIGALEKFGAKTAATIGKNKIVSKFSDFIIQKTFSELPKDASILEIRSAIDKNIAASVAKGMIKITGAGAVEGGTEFTQQIFEGIEKDVANRIIQSNEMADAKDKYNGRVPQEIINEIQKNKFFQDAPDITSYEGIKNLLDQSVNSFAVGAIAGGMGGTMSVATNAVSNKVSNNRFAIYRDIILNDGARNGMISDIEDKVKANEITKEEADKKVEEINKSYSTLRSIPNDLSVGAQREAFALINERDQLTSEIEGKDPNLVVRQKDRITEINNTLTKISENAVQKQAAGEVSVQPEAAVSGEVAQGKSEAEFKKPTQEEKIEVEPSKSYSFEYESEEDIPEELKGIEPLGRTEIEFGQNRFSKKKKKIRLTFGGRQLIEAGLGKEAKTAALEQTIEEEVITVDKPVISQNTTAEVERVKSVAPETEDGATFNLDGTKYEGTGLVVPVVSENTTAEELTPEMIADFVERNQDKIGDNETVKVGIYKFPNSNKISIDLNVVAPEQSREQAIEFGKRADQESLFDLGTFENVKTGGTGQNPMAFSGEQFKEIAKAFKEGRVPNVFETTVSQSSNEITIDNAQDVMAEFSQDESKYNTAQAARRVLKALGGVKIYLHRTNKEYADAIGEQAEEGDKGAYDTSTGAIHINLENGGNAITVFHEAIHHALVTKGISTGAILDLANGLKRIITDKNLISRLDEFISNYEEGDKGEEYVAELGAIMADAQQELTTTKLNKFKALISRVFQKLGLPKNMTPFLNAMKSEDAVAFINDLTKSLRTGKEIKTLDKKFVENPINEIKKSKKIGSKKTKIEIIYAEQDRIDELIENELLEQVEDISEFNNMYVATTSPDDMLVGSILINGEVKAEGNGGVFFVTKFGDIWASSSRTVAEQIKNRINKSLRINNEKGYLVLVKGTDAKLISSPQGASSSLKIVESLVLDGLVSPSDFRKAVTSALELNKDTKAKINFSGKMSSSDMISAVDSLFEDVSKSSFDNRGYLLRSIITELGKTESVKNNSSKIVEFLGGDTNKSIGWSPTSKTTNTSQSAIDLIANVSREELTNGLNGGDIYALIEVDGEVEVVKDKHQSYPYHIKQKNRKSPKLILLKNRLNGREVMESEAREGEKELGKSFDGKVLGRASNGYGEGYISYEGKKVKKQKSTKKEAIQNAKDKYELSVTERGNSHKQGVSAAIGDLQKSDWYISADDTQREEAIREIKSFFGEKIKRAPSVKKIMGEPKPETVTMTVKKLRDEFIKAKNSASIAGRADLRSKQKAIISAINQMKRGGILTSKQASSLAKRIIYLNVDNPVMVDRFMNYAERLFERADYQEVLKNAFSIRNKIRKAAKSKDKHQPEVAGMAKKFAKIDPSLVEDIDLYMEMAEKVYNAIRPVRLTKDGLVTKIAADISEISEYQSNEIKRQEEILKNQAMDMHKYLVDSGAITSEMSLKEIRDIITILENDPNADIQDRESIIRKYINAAFDVYSGIIIEMVKTGIDPMTGEEVEFNEAQKDIIKRLIGIDTDYMKLEDAYKSIEALDNFIVNKITSGVEAIVNSYEGKLNAEKMEKSGIKTRPLKVFFTKIGGRVMGENFASLPVLIDTMFTGVNAAQKFMTLSGLNDFISGVAKATKEQNNIINEYGKKFEKTRPNGMDFRASENVYERGMLAYLLRTIPGTVSERRAELGRRIQLVKDSIEALSNGDKDQKRMSEIYQDIYNKFGLDEFNVNNDNLTTSDIESRADKTNLEAVKWWVDKWAEKYSDLSDVSLSVYNTELSGDINYTPDRYSKIEGEENPIDDANLQKAGSFGMDLNFTDKNKTGVLMETTRPKKTPGRYVNLDFDISNARSMKSALVDINTAGSVRKIDGFLRSPSMKKIVEDKKDRELLQRRINNSIRRSKHKAVINDPTLRELDEAFNYVASIGAVKALGGIFQPIKQTVPVFLNTIFNAGFKNVSLVSVMSDSDMHEWINNSGMPIANRGLEATTAIETANKYLDKVAGSKKEAAIKSLMKLNEFWLKKFLQQPDVWIARSSFIAYYKQSLRRKGVDVSKIDWKTHKMDKDAANYAQHMVDRQQNVSDSALMGEVMASEAGAYKIMRKTLLPFANFIMNQKSRMYSDVRTVFSSEANKDDKKTAFRSLSGLTIELATYQYLAYTIGMMIKSLASNLVGYAPDDEEDEKNKKYAVQNSVNQYIKDIFSPIPLTDGLILKAFDYGADKFQEWKISDEEIKNAVDEENKIREETGKDPLEGSDLEKFKEEFVQNQKYNFEDYKQEKLFNLGTLSIAYDKAVELYEMIELARTGKFTEESYGTEKTKYISKEDQEKMYLLASIKLASLTGALPVEANNLAMYSTKYIKKKSITEKQMEKSNEVKKELGIKELSEYQKELISSKKDADFIISEIQWVEENGGLKNAKQQKEYIKMFKEGKLPSEEDMKRIQKLK